MEESHFLTSRTTTYFKRKTLYYGIRYSCVFWRIDSWTPVTLKSNVQIPFETWVYVSSFL